MAINTTGNNGSVVGVTGVHPDNMGKGIVWNEQTKQYDVSAKDSNGVKVNPDGSVGLALSPDAGNLLELRSNGVGLWEVVEPSLQRQFVDSVGGDDNNAGTKDRPLKTFQRAIQRLYESKNGGKGDASSKRLFGWNANWDVFA